MTMTPERAGGDSGGGSDQVRAAGDRTVAQYQQWMQTNAESHLMRAARQSGITARLRERQHTLDELCETLSLVPSTAGLLLDGLVAIGFVEKYGDDFALARAGHLLCQYDEDLEDSRWETLVDRIDRTKDSPPADFNRYRSRIAATQWIHTAAAMQAAEILDLGGSEPSVAEGNPQPLQILDLGCGSAVWSCAMAHRDGSAMVVAVDQAGAVQAARTMAESISLADRFRGIEGDPRTVAIGSEAFDLVVLPQLLSGYDDADAAAVLQKATTALRSGGRLVAPDLYLGPGGAGIKETLGRLSVHLSTSGGRVRDLRECQVMFTEAGLTAIQFTYLAASEAGLGVIVASKSPAAASG